MGRFIDISGKRFNKLLVLERVENDKSGQAMFNCLCDCGNYTTKRSAEIRGGVISCGCAVTESNKKRARSLIGMEFGRLTVLEKADNGCNGAIRWKCQCRCGRFSIVYGSHLTKNKNPTRSCGCLMIERVTEASIKHGYRYKPVYHSWRAMKKRCTLKNHPDYKNWGARGITYDPRWELFENFFEDMGDKPEGTSLGRKDNSLGYFKENCEWQTPNEQANNKRNNRFITYKGKTKTIAQWARELDIPPTTLGQRIKNWDIERAFTEPVHKEKWSKSKQNKEKI